jgi:N-acetylglucosamine-6-phosphate deacetylase
MMKKIAIKGNLVLPETIIHQGTIVVEGQKISGIFAPRDRFYGDGVKLIDFGDAYIAPGLVDLHLHGALGKDAMDSQEESVQTIAEYQARNGVTGFLPSTMSASLESVLEAMRVIQNMAKNPLPAEILGIYLEGPFVSEKKKGAHSASFIRGMTESDCEELAFALDGRPGILSLAPEEGENMRWIPKLKAAGFVVAIGHTDATYEQAMESFAKGVTHATHLYNAMRGFHHREPGVVGAVLDSDGVTAELIADGIHVHPAALRLAVASKGPERICLVTDSILASGMGDGMYRWGDKEIAVRGHRARIRESGILAGSVLTMNAAIKNMIGWTGVTLNQAVNMASLNPARVLGLDKNIGSIQIGKLANLVVLDQDFQTLDVIFKGESLREKGS